MWCELQVPPRPSCMHDGWLHTLHTWELIWISYGQKLPCLDDSYALGLSRWNSKNNFVQAYIFQTLGFVAVIFDLALSHLQSSVPFLSNHPPWVQMDPPDVSLYYSSLIYYFYFLSHKKTSWMQSGPRILAYRKDPYWNNQVSLGLGLDPTISG